MPSILNVEALELKFSSLTRSRDSITGLSAWIIRHSELYEEIVEEWLAGLYKDFDALNMLYVANDVIMNCSKKKVPQYRPAFRKVLLTVMGLQKVKEVSDKVIRMVNMWNGRGIFTDEFCKDLIEKVTNPEVEEVPNQIPVAITPENVEEEQSEMDIIANYKKEHLIDKLSMLKIVEEDVREKEEIIKYAEEPDKRNFSSLGRKEALELKIKMERYCDVIKKFIRLGEEEIQIRKKVVNELKNSNMFYTSQNEDVKKVAHAYKVYGKKIKRVLKNLSEKRETLPVARSPSPDFSDHDISSPKSPNDDDCSTRNYISSEESPNTTSISPIQEKVNNGLAIGASFFTKFPMDLSERTSISNDSIEKSATVKDEIASIFNKTDHTETCSKESNKIIPAFELCDNMSFQVKQDTCEDNQSQLSLPLEDLQLSKIKEIVNSLTWSSHPLKSPLKSNFESKKEIDILQKVDNKDVKNSAQSAEVKNVVSIDVATEDSFSIKINNKENVGLLLPSTHTLQSPIKANSDCTQDMNIPPKVHSEDLKKSVQHAEVKRITSNLTKENVGTLTPSTHDMKSPKKTNIECNKHLKITPTINDTNIKEYVQTAEVNKNSIMSDMSGDSLSLKNKTYSTKSPIQSKFESNKDMPTPQNIRKQNIEKPALNTDTKKVSITSDVSGGSSPLKKNLSSISIDSKPIATSQKVDLTSTLEKPEKLNTMDSKDLEEVDQLLEKSLKRETIKRKIELLLKTKGKKPCQEVEQQNNVRIISSETENQNQLSDKDNVKTSALEMEGKEPTITDKKITIDSVGNSGHLPFKNTSESVKNISEQIKNNCNEINIKNNLNSSPKKEPNTTQVSKQEVVKDSNSNKNLQIPTDTFLSISTSLLKNILEKSVMPGLMNTFQNVKPPHFPTPNAEVPTLSAKPALPTPSVKPALPTPSAKPVLPTPSIKPVLSTPSAKPVLPTPIAKPVLPTPSAKPVLPTPIAKSVSTTPAAKPVLPTTEVQPDVPVLDTFFSDICDSENTSKQSGIPGLEHSTKSKNDLLEGNQTLDTDKNTIEKSVDFKVDNNKLDIVEEASLEAEFIKFESEINAISSENVVHKQTEDSTTLSSDIKDSDDFVANKNECATIPNYINGATSSTASVSDSCSGMDFKNEIIETVINDQSVEDSKPTNIIQDLAHVLRFLCNYNSDIHQETAVKKDNSTSPPCISLENCLKVYSALQNKNIETTTTSNTYTALLCNNVKSENFQSNKAELLNNNADSCTTTNVLQQPILSTFDSNVFHHSVPTRQTSAIKIDETNKDNLEVADMDCDSE